MSFFASPHIAADAQAAAEAALVLEQAAEAQLKFVRGQDDEHVACRQGHELPRFAPTKSGRIPKGIRAVGPYADGTFDLIRVCSSCGLELSMYSGPGGRLIENKPRRKYPKGYLAKGMGRIPPKLARAVGWERIEDVVLATATLPPTEEDETA